MCLPEERFSNCGDPEMKVPLINVAYHLDSGVSDNMDRHYVAFSLIYSAYAALLE